MRRDEPVLLTMTRSAALIVALAWPSIVPAGETRAVSTPVVGQVPLRSAAAVGEALFSGATPFARAGPPCAKCHGISGLGSTTSSQTPGPDLTAAYDVLGPDQIAVALRTHQFAGTLVFDGRLLTSDERSALEALLEEASASRPPAGASGMFAVVALGGFVVMLTAAWLGMR